MTKAEIADIQNRRAFSSSLAIKAYSDLGELMPAEASILGMLKPRIAYKPLLDIGVGAGRTTAALLDLSRDYTAIDYSEVLVRQTRRRFGLDSVYCRDVRDMRCFTDERFEFVLFSFNGLDCISHEGRLKALGEIHRVLRPHGVFLFSSHNRAYLEDRHSVHGEYTWMESFNRAVWEVLLLPRHLRLRRHETRTSEYAIVNDSGLRYSLLLYYITIRSQVAQLEQLGFSIEGMFNMKGARTDFEDRSAWIHYLVTKESTITRVP